MALPSTIFKVDLQIADMDRNYYGGHSLTVARHPSETDERMMVRVLAFALHASESLQFTKGLSADDEPDLWQKSLVDEIELWVEVGLPDERRLRKACNRARRVFLYAYGGRAAAIWWEKSADQLRRFENLSLFNLPSPETQALVEFVQRAMQLSVTVQEGQIWVSDGKRSVVLEPQRLIR